VWFQNRRAKFRRSERHAFARRYQQGSSDVALLGMDRPLAASATAVPTPPDIVGYRVAGCPAAAASPAATMAGDAEAAVPTSLPLHQLTSYQQATHSVDDFIPHYLPSLTHHVMAGY